MNRFTFFLFCLFFPFLGKGEEIEIHLPLENKLHPLYLSKINSPSPQLEKTYLNRLRDILRFDLHYSGRFNIASLDPVKEKQLEKQKSTEAFSPEFWKNQDLSYIVKLSLEGKQLILEICHSGKKAIKRFTQTELSGDLNKDRKALHRLSDDLTESVFGVRGIAELQLIYSVREKNPKQEGLEWISEIWSCDADGANQKQLTADAHYNTCPYFIPSGQQKPDRFLYVSYAQGQPKIFCSPLNETKSAPLISLRGNQLLPSISIQSNKIAFISDAAGRPDLFIQNFDAKGRLFGKPIQLFSSSRSTQASSSFSPDGENLVFVSDKDGPPRIYLLHIPPQQKKKRPKVELLTKKNRENTSPSWSPDGTKMAYSAKTDGFRQIWIYDFKTDEEWQLTKGKGNKENPKWAPDSLHLVFNSENGLTSDLYLVNMNQPEAVKIAKGRFASWEPRPRSTQKPKVRTL